MPAACTRHMAPPGVPLCLNVPFTQYWPILARTLHRESDGLRSCQLGGPFSSIGMACISSRMPWNSCITCSNETLCPSPVANGRLAPFRVPKLPVGHSSGALFMCLWHSRDEGMPPSRTVLCNGMSRRYHMGYSVLHQFSLSISLVMQTLPEAKIRFDCHAKRCRRSASPSFGVLATMLHGHLTPLWQVSCIWGHSLNLDIIDLS